MNNDQDHPYGVQLSGIVGEEIETEDCKEYERNVDEAECHQNLARLWTTNQPHLALSCLWSR